MRLKRPFASVLLCLAVLLPTLSFAASVAELQTARDNAFRAATQMLMFVALDKAIERRVIAEKAIANVDATVAGLNDANLSARWQTARTSLTTSPYQSGTTNQLQLYAWENEVTAFSNELTRLIPRELDRNKNNMYDLAARMQIMLVIYLRNSADPMGGSNYTGINSDKDLKLLADGFTIKLNEVIRQNPKHALALNKVKSKWVFLSARISDFKAGNVPFIADLYGRQIIDILLSTASS